MGIKFNAALGYEIKKHPELMETIIKELNISKDEYERITDGRLPLIYPDLKKVCEILGLPINDKFFEILEDSFVATSEENGFENPEDYEKILNLINDYIDLKEAIDRYDNKKK